MTHPSIEAGSKFPTIVAKDINGVDVEVGKINSPAGWKVVVVYRGRHCPLCTKYLNGLEVYKERFAENGIELIAVSADSKEQLERHMTELDISFPVYCELTIDHMRELGLYMTLPGADEEVDHAFSEPGLFVVNDDGNVQLVDISNGAFSRPELEMLAFGVQHIKSPEYNQPIRGTYK